MASNNQNTSFSKQFNALWRKSLSFQRRQYKTNVCQAVIPVLMVSIMAILQAATSKEIIVANLTPVDQPPPVTFNPLQFSPTVYYTVGDIEGIDIGTCCKNSTGFLGGFTNTIEDANLDPSYITMGDIPTSNFSFVQLASKQALDSWMYSNFGTNWIIAYLFNIMQFPYQFSFTAIHNDTQGVPAYINLIDNALFRSLTEIENATIITRLKQFPVQAGTQVVDVIEGQENFWYLFMLSFSMIIFVQNIVYEKEHRLREAMKMAGLKMSVYWLVTYLFDLLLFIAVMLVLVIFGNILRFRFFTQTDPSIYIVLFLLFGLSNISLSFLFSTFLSKDQTSSIVTFIYVMFISLTADIMNGSFLGNPETPWAAYVVTALVPHFAFHRAVSFISNNYADDQGYFTWKDLSTNNQLPLLFGFLAMMAVFFLLLQQYLEAVIPTNYGTSLSPIFFLKKSFWSSMFRRSPPITESMANLNDSEGINNSALNNSDPIIVRSQSLNHNLEMDPPDVAAEKAVTLDPLNKDAIKILQLSKTFRSSGRKVDAVNKLTFSVKQGQCFGLLGPNSAGKSTTLNIISGLYTPSSGTAIIHNYDIKTDLPMAQLSLGVCPQDDVLWGELTGREHLLFYGRLKNYTGDELERLVNNSLEEVLLTDAQHKPAKSYSGGMKRRLSLGISLIGSPKAVVLDEPTTGVDPFSRRIVWDVIKSYKSRCAIILTTHNMEEADILCDRVCIIDHGVMKCIGQTVELKSRYGAGYSLTITGNAPTPSSSGGGSVQQENDEISEFIQELIPGAILVNSLAGTRSFAVPRAAVKLSVLFSRIEESKIKLGITDWGITLSNLEEVLLQTCKHDE